MNELRWYLEQFLDYPLPPETERAHRVRAALSAWGEVAFDGLFGSSVGNRMLAEATANGYDRLCLQIESSAPGVMSWPWEALRDPQAGSLGQIATIERHLEPSGSPPGESLPVTEKLPDGRIHVLMITARPDDGIAYRTISRPLVELIRKEKLSARIHMLRPPTLEHLQQHLRENPDTYHVLHFDGHGVYEQSYLGMIEGQLTFEDEAGQALAVPGRKLAQILKPFSIPVVVLNACRSAMLDPTATDAFVSVATALLRSGTSFVVAMAYALHVSGAQQFLAGFYRRLLETGSVAEAVRAGRQNMARISSRVCARGRFHLEDWLIPVLYRQRDLILTLGPEPRSESAPGSRPVSARIKNESAQEHLIGRDMMILRMERAVRQESPAILVHGLDGIGKTALVRGMVEWLQDTGGIGRGNIWQDFREAHSAEFVFHRLARRLFGHELPWLDAAQMIKRLTDRLRREPWWLVWDNFEVVAGIAGTKIRSTLSETDRENLKTFLERLRGGATKVVVTSRSVEPWLGEHISRLPLTGLSGEERWEYCEHVLGRFGLHPDQSDSEFLHLLELLGGHPLAMRVMLPELAKKPASALIEAFRSDPTSLHFSETAGARRLDATLTFAERALPADLAQLLVPLSLHQRFVDRDYFEIMGGLTKTPPERHCVGALLESLSRAGLLHDHGQSLFEIHPALTGFLRSAIRHRASTEHHEQWIRAFVTLMAHLANQEALKESNVQRINLYYYHDNFLSALAEAERLEMDQERTALLQALAVYTMNQRRYSESTGFYQKLAALSRRSRQPLMEALAYYQIGTIAHKRYDFTEAERFYHRSLAISSDIGEERGMSLAYHHMGILAQDQRRFRQSLVWHRKSFHLKRKSGDDRGLAMTYHQLGRIAQSRYRYRAAERWYRKSLCIKEKIGDEEGAVHTYSQRGSLARDRRDFHAAEKWYREALRIEVALGDYAGAASSYFDLGRLAHEQENLEEARRMYQESLQIRDHLGDKQGAALVYHEMGMLALQQEDLNNARKWCEKALEVQEALGIESGKAATYHQLGEISQKLGDLARARSFYEMSIDIAEKLDDKHGAALTYGRLGILSVGQERLEESGLWFLKALRNFRLTSDSVRAGHALGYFKMIYDFSGVVERRKFQKIWEQLDLGNWPFGDDGSEEQAH